MKLRALNIRWARFCTERWDEDENRRGPDHWTMRPMVVPVGCDMLLYHATQAESLDSIGREGVSTAHSEGAIPAVWGCEWSMRHWSVLHCVRRHGGDAKNVVVLEIDTQDTRALRFRGGLWYSLHTWHPSQIRRVLTFDELSRSPTEEG